MIEATVGEGVDASAGVEEQGSGGEERGGDLAPSVAFAVATVTVLVLVLAGSASPAGVEEQGEQAVEPGRVA